MSFFSTGIQSLLSKLQENNPGIVVLGYLEEFLGESGKALSVLEELKSHFSAVGLHVADHKCDIYSPSQSVCQSIPSSLHIPILWEEVSVLGIPIGTGHYVTEISLQLKPEIELG